MASVDEIIALQEGSFSPASVLAARVRNPESLRNLPGHRWRVVGAGSAGTHWTVNFGAETDGSEPRVSE